MTEQIEADPQERAWATAQARAFLAPPAEASGAAAMRRRAEPPCPAAVVAVLVGPLPLPVPREAMRRCGVEGTGRRRRSGMAEPQTEQPCWRVVTHEPGGGGWWTLCPQRFWERVEAEGWAAGALRRGAGHAGVYPEVGGRVQVPGWITVREGSGT